MVRWSKIVAMGIVREAEDMLEQCDIDRRRGPTDSQQSIQRWRKAWRLYGKDYADRKKEFRRYLLRMQGVVGYDEAVQVSVWLHRALVAVVQEITNINSIVFPDTVLTWYFPPFTVPECDCEITPWAERELQRRVRNVGMRYRD